MLRHTKFNKSAKCCGLAIKHAAATNASKWAKEEVSCSHLWLGIRVLGIYWSTKWALTLTYALGSRFVLFRWFAQWDMHKLCHAGHFEPHKSGCTGKNPKPTHLPLIRRPSPNDGPSYPPGCLESFAFLLPNRAQ